MVLVHIQALTITRVSNTEEIFLLKHDYLNQKVEKHISESRENFGMNQDTYPSTGSLTQGRKIHLPEYRLHPLVKVSTVIDRGEGSFIGKVKPCSWFLEESSNE